MSVRSSLLAILRDGPAYGYQLRGEFESRTGGSWPLNVGQVYSTLDRLQRDGFVVSGGADAEGRTRYELTETGLAEVRSWLASPVVRQATRDELAMKLTIAVSMPGVDIAEVVQVQRAATLGHLQSLTRTKADATKPGSASELAWSLVLESMLYQAEAEVRWLDHVESLLGSAVRQGIVRGTPRSDRSADAAAQRAEAAR